MRSHHAKRYALHMTEMGPEHLRRYRTILLKPIAPPRLTREELDMLVFHQQASRLTSRNTAMRDMIRIAFRHCYPDVRMPLPAAAPPRLTSTREMFSHTDTPEES